MNEKIVDQFMDHVDAFANKNNLNIQETCRLLIAFSIPIILECNNYDISKARKYISGLLDNFEEMLNQTKVLHDKGN